jgi:hypothetical protein
VAPAGESPPAPPAAPKAPLGAFRTAGNIARGLGTVTTVLASVQDTISIIAEEKPEWLPKGKRIELMKPNPTPFRGDPRTAVPSGYTVENQGGGRIIYRNAEGKEVTKETVMDALNGIDRA